VNLAPSAFVRELPGDAVRINIPRQVRGALYTPVDPTPVRAPRLLAWSDDLADFLGLDVPSKEQVEMLAGNQVAPGTQPYAARYGGHQFGQWAGQLGDGRAITLGEMVARDGTHQELQLKGAGKTPYARTADGRAVLRSSLREFLCSEAMHWLGVPTTRALSLVGTGEMVIRDMFYDGNPEPEPGAVVCRVAPSFIRFGNFQILAAHEELEELKRLNEYVARHFYGGKPWFQELCRRTGALMADWMRLGFVHGVMNTDNMSILGLTIDYGPYGWLEGYDPAWTPNTTDAQGRRYCYGNQPHIALWNLTRLAEALLPIVPREELEKGLALYEETFRDAWGSAMAQKLGVQALDQPGDDELVKDLFELLAKAETDFTLFFRGLAGGDVEKAFYAEKPEAELRAWLDRYSKRIESEDQQERVARMNGANPKYVFRNYLAQQAIDALALGDAAPLQRLMRVLKTPYDEHPGEEALAERRPEWARHKAGCSALSCSS
jgi:uncharacterized protein YdiU (UPF0061 family)